MAALPQSLCHRQEIVSLFFLSACFASTVVTGPRSNQLLINTSCVIAGLRTTHQSPCTPMFELGEVSSRSNQAPKFGELLVRRPVAATALLPNSVVLFTAGAVAGALGVPCCLGLHLHLSQHVSNKLSNGPAYPNSLQILLELHVAAMISDCSHRDAARLDQADIVSCRLQACRSSLREHADSASGQLKIAHICLQGRH